MAHQIGKKHSPKKGSLAYWPKKRAKKHYPSVKNWGSSDQPGLLGFAAYKAGMAHVIINDNRKHSRTKGLEVSVPVTILDAPPINVIAIKYYKNDKTAGQKFAPKLDKELSRKTSIPKNSQDSQPKNFDDVRILISTQPSFKKKPEVMEVGLGGKTVSEKHEFAQTILGKQVNVDDVFKPGEQADTIAVTKGKGFQGSVKRFGVSIAQAKAEKTKRAARSIGQFTPGRTRRNTPQFGQLGFHKRTEHNKWIMKIGEEDDANPEGGYKNYGKIKNKYLLLKGSVPGSRKRLVVLRKPVRQSKRLPQPEIVEVVT